MHAAVVRSFDAPPRYETFQTPQPSGEHEISVDVLAAGLHPRVRSGASGSHYTSTEALPLIPGVDGVGRSVEGQLLYFVAFGGAFGSMAEQAVVDRRRTVAVQIEIAALSGAPGFSVVSALLHRHEASQYTSMLRRAGRESWWTNTGEVAASCRLAAAE